MNRPVSFQHLAPEYVQRFEAYIPSKPDDELKKLFGCSHLFRLNNNENPLGPCPSAAKVIRGFVPSRASIYPSGDCWHLRQKLAEKHGMNPDQFLFGNGANEVIAFVIKAFCQQGDNIITADKTFAVYEWVAEFSGIEARRVPLKDYGFDDDEMIHRIDDHTKILFVCNPNNPTGTYWDSAKLKGFLNRVNGRRIVVVDEAYCEFVENPDFPDSMAMIKEHPNLVVFRTFSKMHALAGLRIGYLAGSREAVDIIRRTCVVYSVKDRKSVV
jgi:histidinol-phosphate aminotransferase